MAEAYEARYENHKRLLRSSMIVRAADGQVDDFFDVVLDSICASERHEPSTEALAQMEANALPLYQETVKILLRIVPNYVAESMRRIPSDMDEAFETMTSFREEIVTRLENSQHDRIVRVITMFKEFYASQTQPSDRTMFRLRDCIIHSLPDLCWIYAEPDEYILDWMYETLRKLIPMVCDT